LNLRTKAAAYGIAGLVLASAAIITGMNLGVITPGAAGALSVMLTDPPNVPKGVTAIYITYDYLGLHPAGFGQGDWVTLGTQGALETLGLVNISETISNVNIPALNYDQIAFEISSAKVEFHGVNYSATVNGGRLVATMPGGLVIGPSKPSVVLLDILPTVLNLGDRVTPHLVIAAGVKALPVPQSEVSPSMSVLQNRITLTGNAWSQPLMAARPGNVTIGGTFLSSNSFSFEATNHGSQPFDLRMVVIAPVSPLATVATATDALSNSFVFVVDSNGTLQILHTDDIGPPQSVLGGAGFTLAPGASVHFSYSGPVTTVRQGTPTSKGTPYYVFVVGQAVPPQTVDAD
jgi:Domain of unknown function (DUF4382)